MYPEFENVFQCRVDDLEKRAENPSFETPKTVRANYLWCVKHLRAQRKRIHELEAENSALMYPIGSDDDPDPDLDIEFDILR